MPQNRFYLLIIPSVVFGAGLSFIEWGDPNKVHGTGLPFPTNIRGLAENSPSEFKSFADLNEIALGANSLVTMFFLLFLWAVAKIWRRLNER